MGIGNRRGIALALGGIMCVFMVAAVSAAGPLSKIVLSISPDQVVGQPLQISAQMILLDSTNNLKTDYDLQANPITLTPTSGSLNPFLLSDTSLFSGGIINFLSANVAYTGQSGKIPIKASNGTVQSSNVIVSFNGYDILKVFDFKGDPLTQVYQGLPTTIRAAVRNGGSLLAVANPSLRTYFTSGGGSIRVFFPPHRDGVIDTVTIVDTALVNPGSDTLVLELDSRYQVNGNSFLVASLAKLPVTVLTPASVSFVSGSFKPDSAYAGTAFPLSFAVATSGFSGPIDSSTAQVQLYRAGDTAPAATLFNGSTGYSTFQNDTIRYNGLAGHLDAGPTLSEGWYQVRVNYRLISGGSVFTLSDISPDSLYVLPQNGPSYVNASLLPGDVAAGAEVSFQFKLLVNGAGLEIEPGTATFSLAGTGFAATVNLMIPNNHLESGENTLTVENIFIPGNQLGKTLRASTELHYRLSGTPTYLVYTLDFNGQQIGVRQLPVVQILSVSSVEPNRPKVNTHQSFQILAELVNLSSSPIDSVKLRLTTNGLSLDSLLTTVRQIPAGATDTVTFDVVADDQPNDAEVFSVAIVATDAQILPPVDNIAVVTIQQPAILALTHTLAGAQGGYLAYGEQFSLVMALQNLYRDNGTTPASYRLSTGGVDFGIPPEDTLGEITDRTGVSFSFTAPNFDTTVTIEFQITTLPLDMNTGLPATVSDNDYRLTVHVISGQASLAVTPTLLRSVPLVIGEAADLFSLHLANGASPGGSTAQITSIALRFSDRLGTLINIHDLFDLTHTGLFLGNAMISTAATTDNQLTLRLHDLTVPTAGTLDLVFRAEVRQRLDNGMGIRIDSSSIEATFIDGPNQGQSVQIVPPAAGQPVLSAVFATSQSDFVGSFVVENNPWHPGTGHARFAYNLDQNAALEFRVFTLTGEEVISQEIPSSSPLATPGSHIIEWDGRNGAGDLVLDGVYIVSLRNVITGTSARLKLAVLK